jgi:hypothetical protein
MTLVANTTCTDIPCLRYPNTLQMIDWLRDAFGFEQHALSTAGEMYHHAQLVFAHYGRTNAAGMLIMIDIAVYDCLSDARRDPQGHLSCFGGDEPRAKGASARVYAAQSISHG